MKRTICMLCIGLLLTFCLLFSCCKKKTDTDISDPDESSAETSLPQTESSTDEPVAYDPLELLLQCVQITEDASSFSTSLEGSCSTQVLFLSYNQQIRSERTVTTGAMFSQSVSVSSLVRVGVQQYFQGNTVLVRSGEVHSLDEVIWADGVTAVTPEAYHDAYGKTPHAFSNYIINADTVLSVYLESASDDEFTIVCELDPVSSTTEYAKQVKTMGGLDKLPVFQSVTLTVTMDSTLRPLRVRYQERYEISFSLLGETTCKADYTETFSNFDAVTEVPEQVFFEPFLQQPAELYPEISSGYSLLYALLGNSASYEVTLEAAGQAFPLRLSLDVPSGRILLRGETADFLYDGEHYYFLSEKNRVFADAEAFNERLLSLTGQFPLQDAPEQGGELSSLFSNLQIQNENGNILLHAGDDKNIFSASIDFRTLSLLSAELRLSDSDIPFHILIEKASNPSSFPSLSDCLDLTPALPAFSLLEQLVPLREGKALACRLELDGSTPYTADLTLAFREQLVFSLLPTSGALPLSIYGQGEMITAVWEQLTLSGTFSDFPVLLALLSGTQPSAQAEGARNAIPRLLAKPGKLLMQFDGASPFTLTITGSEVSFSGDGFFARLSGFRSSGAKKVPTAPKTAYQLSMAKLTSFLSGSVYLDLLHADAASCSVQLARGGESTQLQVRARLTGEAAVGLTTTWNGKQIDLLYTDETLFLSSAVFDAFLPVEALPAFAEQFSALSGDEQLLPNIETPSLALTSLSCDGERLILSFGDVKVTLEKDRFTVSHPDWKATGTKLSPMNAGTSFSPPDRRNCIDLVALVKRVSILAAQRTFSFTGSYQDETVSASLSRLEFSVEDGIDLKTIAGDVLPEGMDTLVHFLFDGSGLYLDIGETHLFCLAEALFPDGVPQATPGASELPALLSDLRKLTFRDNILTVETADMLLRIVWEGETLSRLSYSSGDRTLSLRSAVFAPAQPPQLELYTDLTPLAGLLPALSQTADAGSFAFDGQIDLRAFSLTLRGIQMSGALRFSEQGAEGAFTFDVPYLPGVTSDGVPLMRDNLFISACKLRSELFLTDGKLYLRRTVDATYGFLQPQTYTATESGYLTLEEAVADPMRVLSFLLRLEPEMIGSNGEIDTPQGRMQTGGLFKRVSCAGNRYTIAFNPAAFFPEADSILLTMQTDGAYLTGVEASITRSSFSIVASGRLYAHGDADPSDALQQDFSSYEHMK